MFERIRAKWREARGPVLRREFCDAVLRLNGLDRKVTIRASVVLAKAYRDLEATHGTLTDISNDGKRRLSKELLKQAKKSFTFDMGSGYGLAMLSIYLESQTVPGKDSEFVRDVLNKMVNDVLSFESPV